MKREKYILGILTFTIALIGFLSKSLMVFSALFFISALGFSFWISHKHIGKPEYNKIYKEIYIDYKASFHNFVKGISLEKTLKYLFYSPKLKDENKKK